MDDFGKQIYSNFNIANKGLYKLSLFKGFLFIKFAKQSFKNKLYQIMHKKFIY